MRGPDALLSKFRRGEFTRVVAFGSSNTERHFPGMHWFDCFELACRTQIGSNLVAINSGRRGDSTLDLLTRIERDCLAYRPDLVFITVGGNDSFPDRGITPADYRVNLENLIQQIRSAGGHPVLQTYYSFDLENAGPRVPTAFLDNMQTVREVAQTNDCHLIDHLVRWELLRQHRIHVYRNLLVDPFHVNATGNLLLGLDIVRAFGLNLPEDPIFEEGRELQGLLDELSGKPD